MDYLRWHYFSAPKFILTLIGNYLFFVEHLFSVRLLLKTLFSPWRNLTTKKEKPGISPSELFRVLTFKVISSFLGFLIRTSTIFVSLIFFILVILFGIFIFFLWLIIPFLTLPFYLASKKRDNPKKREEFIATHLEENPKTDDLSAVADWFERKIQEEKRKSQFWTRENLLSVPGIGTSWAYGYTPLLDHLTANLSEAKFPLERLVGRKSQIEQLQRILSKEENNDVFLVGEPGVGRKTITIGLAKLIEAGKCFDSLLFKKVLLLDVQQLVSRSQTETEQNLVSVLEEAKSAKNIILVIPSFEQFVSDSHINLTEVFAQHLGGEEVQLIGLTDPLSYQKYILRNPQLLKVFEKIDVLEVSKDEGLSLLENLSLDLEKKYKITITYQALQEIIKESDELISDVPFPEKSIDLLEEAVVFAKSLKKEKVTAGDIDLILSEKTNLPLGEVTYVEKTKLQNLEEIFHKRVVGQDQAITKISNALRRKRAGVEIKSSPIGTFLFLGSTGVGKTETAKALSEVYFGDEDKMVRFDMSEFQTEDDIVKLIGDGEKVGTLTTLIRQNPFSVLLLDEFEKANAKILNIFLTVFDEGYITDGAGKKVSFKNTLIIATSNAGSEFIREGVQKETPAEILEKSLIEYLLSQKIFTPELLNRFDAVVFYKPLTRKELELVANFMLAKLNKKLEDEKGIIVKISSDSLKKLIEKGYDPVFGARSLQRVMEEDIENKVAEKILSENLEKGAVIEI